ncbi:F0F1 ATP synthase subunit delta [Mycetohabitans sp. B46]|uniref:F0F1 ATP synthase subunit delta n=1 Tax=Mycetohabitans sp. B46 TaxID=2772536 RepID=UPI00307F657B
MAELATIARPYAEALFGVASTDRAADLATWSALVQELAQVARLPEVLSIVSSPKVGRQQVVDLLLAALKSSVKDSPAAKNFVQMLVENHRVQLLPEIAAQFDALKNAQEGAADVTIESAFALDEQSLADLVAALERKFQRKLKPTVKLEPALIGGVRVTVGDEVLDTSVRARLAAMQTALTA